MTDPIRSGPAPIDAAATTAGGPSAAASARFTELLERLQRLAQQQRAATQPPDAAALREALRSADDGFAAAMDVRRRLEEAFRRHWS